MRGGRVPLEETVPGADQTEPPRHYRSGIYFENFVFTPALDDLIAKPQRMKRKIEMWKGELKAVVIPALWWGERG